MATLPKDCNILNGKYKVLLLIKQGIYAETYRLKSTDGKLYFLKLFDLSRIPRSGFDKNNNLLEIEIVKSISHPNLISYKESGELIHNRKSFVS